MPRPPIDPPSPEGTPKVRPDKTLEGGRISQPDSSSFEAYKEKAPSATTPEQQTGQISPMDLAAKNAASTTPTYQTLLSQSMNVRDSLGDIEKNLKTPKLKLKKSQSNLLNTKLKNANEHLDSAIKKMGATPPENSDISTVSNPVARFLTMITDGQKKLAEAHNTLQNLKTEKGQLQPGDMLLIQIKLSQAQQEIEYSSVLLSKVVDSLKQIMNIQM